jgi:pilus assembly protein Flp/PilA
MIFRLLKNIVRSNAGATAVEYGLILGLIVIAAMSALVFLADTTIGMWDAVADNVTAH